MVIFGVSWSRDAQLAAKIFSGRSSGVQPRARPARGPARGTPELLQHLCATPPNLVPHGSRQDVGPRGLHDAGQPPAAGGGEDPSDTSSAVRMGGVQDG